MDKFSDAAKWIGSGNRIVTRTTGERSPALQLRKIIYLSELRSAECLVCGLGFYVLYLNGKKVGSDVLSPSFTAYDKRALYMKYDVSGYLRKGKNVVAVKLGDGFYNQTTRDVWGFYQAPWRDCVKLLFELKAGGKTVCVSDESWKCTYDGATTHTAIRTGEYYDARKEDGWREFGYDDTAWRQAQIVAPPGGILRPQKLPPICECEELEAIDVWKTKKGWAFDFGKNIAGYVRLKYRGRRGATAVLSYSEKLDGKELDQSNISALVPDADEFSTDKYTFCGAGEEVWKPEFVYHGFRYAELSGVENPPDRSALTAYFVHTDLRKKGTLHTSDELLDWIYEAGIRSFLSNFHGFSEDCPHREKNGWTGDAAISCDYAVWNFEMKEAYKKWLEDICDSQRENGQLPGIAPTGSWGYNWGSGPAWDCALFFLPYVLYRETGNRECFDVVYRAAEKYLAYAAYYRRGGLVCYGLGDWCPPDLPDLKLMSNELSDSCYYYAMQAIMAMMCKERGEGKKAERYARSAEETKSAIRKKYIRADGVDTDGQGALAEVLYFRIVEGTEAEKLAQRLAEKVKEDNYKFKVGILGQKALLEALSSYGYTHEAYRAVARYDFPSYGYWKKNGATTLWENWDGSGSRNHHMYGGVLDWIFRYIAGIRNTGTGYDTCEIVPYFFAEDCSAEAETETPHGKLSVAWQKTAREFVCEAEIPRGVNAILKLDEKQPQKILSGKIKIYF